MFVHFPIVLSSVGLLLAVIAAIAGQRSPALRWTALGLYLALTLATYLARESGEDAEHAIEGSLSEEAEEELEAHEHHGEDLWLWPAGISILLGLSFARVRPLRLAAAWLAVGAGVLAADRIAHTAHHGGRLVYIHGAGTPDNLAMLLAGMDGGDRPDDPRAAFFVEEVRPILVEHCMRCHNPSRLKRSGQLDQTNIAGILKGGVSGPAVLPGKPDESLLITAVRWEDPDLQMPAGKEKLADEQIAALEKWVEDGAVWVEFEWDQE